MSESFSRTIAIVGSGYSGTATAVQLLRKARDRSVRIVLIERGPEFGRGLAYARSAYPYLLNVPASRMSATESDPTEFLRFAQRRCADVTADDFLPRAWYGDYLQELLAAAIAGSHSAARIEERRGEVVEVTDATPGMPVVLTLADGERLSADDVVLALGTPLPRWPAAVHCAAEWPALRQDPWADAPALAGRGPLLVIGTGLTMIDVVCAAVAREPGVMIHALSRHGLIPPSQTAFRPDALPDDGGLLAMSAGSTLKLVAAVRRLAREAERRGGDWREAVTHVRRQAPRLWSSLSDGERGRFLRHARTYWDIHRHRVPAPVLARLDALRAAGQLSVHAGHLLSLAPRGGGVRATWRTRGATELRTLDAGAVVNCTGPDYNVTRSPDRLWQALLDRGLAVADALLLGIRTGPCGALVGQDGSTSRCLYYVGPMLRADHWEATAVGELRVHAERLASRLMARPTES